jgi:hypothetical protein
MKHLLTTLLLAACAVTGYGQTVKSLGYNTTNGEVVYNNTNTLTFTNQPRFSAVTIGDTNVNVETLLEDEGVSFYLDSLTNADVFLFNLGYVTASASMAMGVPISFVDASAAATTRTNLGLGATNAVRFGSILLYGDGDATNSITYSPDGLVFNQNGVAYFSLDNSEGGSVLFNKPIQFLGTNAASNRTITMRSLSGSTNTNHPFSGSVSVVGTNNTNTLVFTNGILLEVTAP